MKNDSLKKSIDFIKTSQGGVGRREERITLRNERWGIMTISRIIRGYTSTFVFIYSIIQMNGHILKIFIYCA